MSTERLPLPARARAAVHLGPWRRVGLLAVLATVAATLYMTVGVRAPWSFVLPFRGQKLLALATVAVAIAIATVLFQTLTRNRILTPSIMGFDALYLLLQSGAVFFFGSVRWMALGSTARFALEVGLMVGVSVALYVWLLVARDRGLHLLVLVGIVFGVLFRSFSGLMQRLLDPTEFAVLQAASFASFNTCDSTLLVPTVVTVAAVLVLVACAAPALDVLTLGREPATALGLGYRHTVVVLLVAVSALVAVSTALVGPVTFFGLLVANLAYPVAGSPFHRHVLPVAVLLAIATLVGGQVLFERCFGMAGTLSMVIEFLGGLVFLALLARGALR